MISRTQVSEQVVILAPFGRDATIAAGILSGAGHDVLCVPDLAALAETLHAGAGAAIVAEEALRNQDTRPLEAWLEAQPAWSDFPFIVMSLHKGAGTAAPAAQSIGALLGNVSLLERPFHPVTLISLVAAAIRSRRRQYEARRMLEELTAGALALEESQDHYRHTIEFNPQVTWTARPDGELDRVAARWQDWTGTSGLGDSWGDAIHEDDLQRTIDAWRTSCATGTGYDVRHRIRMKSGEYRWMRSRAFPRRNPDGTIVGWYGTTEDIDGEKIAEDRQLLLIRELHHRVKNTLATVQAVMGSTARASTSMQEFQEAFSARIAALARTHTLLTGDQWQQVSFRDLFDAELAPYADCRRITLSGPHLELSSDIAVPLGMAIHELTTNAAKYGALSAANGAIEVDWTLRRDAPASVTWCWRETGGPPVRPPTHAGFGTKLLQRVLKQQIGAEVQFRYGSPGLVVEAVIPLP